MQSPFEGLEYLKNKLPGSGLDSVFHVTEYLCMRRTKDGTEQEVNVKILDHGPNTEGIPRYMVVATTKDGRAATGNSSNSLETALAMVHWGDLDKKPRRKVGE